MREQRSLAQEDESCRRTPSSALQALPRRESEPWGMLDFNNKTRIEPCTFPWITTGIRDNPRIANQVVAMVMDMSVHPQRWSDLVDQVFQIRSIASRKRIMSKLGGNRARRWRVMRDHYRLTTRTCAKFSGDVVPGLDVLPVRVDWLEPAIWGL